MITRRSQNITAAADVFSGGTGATCGHRPSPTGRLTRSDHRLNAVRSSTDLRNMHIGRPQPQGCRIRGSQAGRWTQ